MRTAIFYFSGTGNTKKVVDVWLSSLNSLGIYADIFSVEKENTFDLGEYDKIGFAYPIHAFNAPEIMLEFAKKLLASGKPLPAYVIMVSGEPLRLNDSSDRKLKKILKGKNIAVESSWHYIMPYNMIFHHTEENAFRMYETVKNLVPMDAYEYFVLGKNHVMKTIPGTGPITSAFRIEQWFSHRNGKMFRVGGDCIRCMKCVSDCPRGNISVKNGKITFSGDCILCTRCSFSCPKGAISIGLLDFWKVNGPYKFRKPEKREEDRHSEYCKGSYARYFREAEERIANAAVR